MSLFRHLMVHDCLLYVDNLVTCTDFSSFRHSPYHDCCTLYFFYSKIWADPTFTHFYAVSGEMWTTNPLCPSQAHIAIYQKGFLILGFAKIIKWDACVRKLTYDPSFIVCNVHSRIAVNAKVAKHIYIFTTHISVIQDIYGLSVNHTYLFMQISSTVGSQNQISFKFWDFYTHKWVIISSWFYFTRIFLHPRVPMTCCFWRQIII